MSGFMIRITSFFLYLQFLSAQEHVPCLPGYMKCAISNRCYHSDWWCDGDRDCGSDDDSDEPSECEPGPCRQGYRRCILSKRCFPSEMWCITDCRSGDYSVEPRDCEPGPCRQGYWRCAISKRCVPSSLWCNGHPDCGLGDYTDEPSDCACPELKLRNGRLSADCLRHKNQSCDIICNSGYRPKVGSGTITCGPSFQWLQNVQGDVCKEIICPKVDLKNGTLSSKCRRLAHQICEFTCDAGFHPKDGMPFVRCGPLGRWVDNIEDVCEETDGRRREGIQSITIAAAIILILFVVTLFL